MQVPSKSKAATSTFPAPLRTGSGASRRSAPSASGVTRQIPSGRDAAGPQPHASSGTSTEGFDAMGMITRRSFGLPAPAATDRAALGADECT